MILVLIILAYLLGSFPTAWLINQFRFRRDIRQQGSGNVGTLNFLRVTRSIPLALIVLLLDTGKAFLAVWLSSRYINGTLLLFPVLAVLAGHIYPVWLKGKGGRGMAALAGVFLYLAPYMVALWWIVFGLLYLFTRKYIIAGLTALFITNITIALVHGGTLFLISSAGSVLVFYQYLSRLKSELEHSNQKKGEFYVSEKDRTV
ncbi:MAG: glycerol-3-phosphate acyltransferase [Calditrichia bacterium]